MKRFYIYALTAGACAVAVLAYLFAHSASTYNIDFDESMRLSEFPEKITDSHNKKLYEIFKKNYEKNHPAKFIKGTPGQCRIPKVIHQIWLGSPFPEKYRAYQESWKKHHPDWEYRLWTDKEMADFPLQHRDLYDASCNYGEKSDIAKFEILYQLGGVYVDTDFECLQPLDELHHAYDFYIGVQPLDTVCVQLGLGLFGSVKGNPLIGCYLENLSNNARQVQQIVNRTGPLYFTRVFAYMSSSLPDRTVTLPASYLYPMCYEERGMAPEVWKRPESLGVHHWEGSWTKKEGFVPQAKR